MQTRRPNTSLSIEILADLRSTSEFLDSLMLRSSNSPGRERVPQKLHARPIFERAPFFRGTDSASRGEVSSSRVRGVSTVPRKAFLSERSAKATRPAEVTGRRSSRRILNGTVHGRATSDFGASRPRLRERFIRSDAFRSRATRCDRSVVPRRGTGRPGAMVFGSLEQRVVQSDTITRANALLPRRETFVSVLRSIPIARSRGINSGAGTRVFRCVRPVVEW